MFSKKTTSNTSTLRGYFGDYDFLDSQEAFYNTFGTLPTLLGVKPLTNDANTVTKQVQAFLDRFKLDIFLFICGKDYVGTDKIDEQVNLTELGRSMLLLKQESQIFKPT